MNETGICGADVFGKPCVLPPGHNMGRADLPENHQARPSVAPLGTCKQIGCPQWGVHPPHGIGLGDIVVPSPAKVRESIGAGTWDDYAVTRCLGFPVVKADDFHLWASCSLGGPWVVSDLDELLSPQDMAALVDRHNRDCPNRQVRP